MKLRLLSVLVLALPMATVSAGCDKAPDASTAPGSTAPASSSPVSEPEPEPAPVPAPASAIALLGGLRVGDELAGWKVAAITLASDPPTKGAIAIDLAQHDTKFTIWVARKGRSSVRAPHATQDFDVFFGPSEIQAAAVKPALERVLERVKANEANAPAGEFR
jgi:hypothetical protein